ncbi:DNA-directed RNA polymerase III subunit RPC7 isoform X2 [Harpia harpyja]|uniref:DNA-directed RNA polymerase III subunit RPC7 isoform X2 n=1 Tax=Harpia harpyja TaxID=202280 RepID=UPI0022B114F7|nr:DNA-directed RNA polymerase III subunit RPC7 isoform X2 [Harpia harpyja]
MAGSGTGRGRTAFTFNIDALGFGKGAALPDTVSKPPPTYPSTENKPVPLKTGEDEDYMLALKQDLRATMKQMPYFLAVEEDREVIERYRKKYQNSGKEHQTWTPDWRRLPREVKPKKKTKKACFCRVVNQILQQQLELFKDKIEKCAVVMETGSAGSFVPFKSDIENHGTKGRLPDSTEN